ncbi:Uncharacterized protein OBRU01_06006 [Operophtera brumata]|uniref:Uncharacterized protein n=1 Tax=Operophtera brumata TaxID=104452 RepID=A0A0L7LMX7_OPEBR|nr:Uncharacterized protein OBRU01_06006 [Operophtera brumata]
MGGNGNGTANPTALSALTDKLAESDQERDHMRMELRSSNISLQDVQQRLQTLQRDKEKEDILVEKGATINRLARELEAAQSRLVGGETVRLKERAAQLCAERNAAKEQMEHDKLRASKGSRAATAQEASADLLRELERCSAQRKDTLHENAELNNLYLQVRSLYVTCTYTESVEGESRGDGAGGERRLVARVGALQRTAQGHAPRECRAEQLVSTASKGSRAATAQEASADLLRELERCSAQRKDTLHENAELNNLYLQVRSLYVTCTYTESVEGESRGDGAGGERRLVARVGALQRTAQGHAPRECRAEQLVSTASKGSRAATAQEASADLLRELERCSAQRKDTLHENAELNNLYLQVRSLYVTCTYTESVEGESRGDGAGGERRLVARACSARDAVNRELKDVTARTQLEREHFNTQERDYVERMEKYKQQIEKLNSELTSCRSELETANKRISELQREFTDKQKEKEMEPCMQCERHLKNVKYLDEQLSKCTKLQEQKSVGTNTEDVSTSAAPRSESIEHMVQDCDDVAAKKFTLEIKTIEMNCARRIKEIESEQLDAVAKLKELLERKAQEVETLKQFIIAERNKVTQILESKEKEISELIKEHNDMQADCQKAKDLLLEWKVKAEKYKERASRLGSLEDALKSEREDWKQKNSSCSREYQAMKVRVTEMQSKLAQMEEIREKLQMDYQLIQDKYRHAKKTIMTYKEYITKKDTHVNSEMNRIQDEYRKIFVKLQNQINYQVNCRIQQEKPSHSQAQSYHQTDVSRPSSTVEVSPD